jgi:DNA-binding transcriptional LysR family regulator
MIVNTTDAAIDAAVAGQGLTCVLSYQAEAHLAAGQLHRVLADEEPPPIPIHLLHPAGHYLPAKVRLFIDHAAAALRETFGQA